MRRTAIVLASAVAVLELTRFAVEELRLVDEFGSVFELGTAAWVYRLVMTVVMVVPWVVGVVLLGQRRHGLATAVIVPVAIMAVPEALLIARSIVGLVSRGWDGAGLWPDVLGRAAIWLFVVAAGIWVWRGRPRHGLRHDAPGRGNAFVIVAFLAWLPTVLASTQVVVPGAVGTPDSARHFYEFIWDASATGLGAVVGVSEAVLFGALLLVGPGLRRDLAGAVLLVVVAPALVTEVLTIVVTLGESLVIPTPASLLGTVGLAGVAVIATRWLVQGLRDRPPPPPAVAAQADPPADPA